MPSSVEKKTLEPTLIPDNLDLAERYEELRSQALGKVAIIAMPLGMALFLHKGMAAWISAWSRPLNSLEIKDSAQEPLPDVLRCELAMLLAGMLLNRRSKDESAKSNPVSSAAQRLSLYPAVNT